VGAPETGHLHCHDADAPFAVASNTFRVVSIGALAMTQGSINNGMFENLFSGVMIFLPLFPSGIFLDGWWSLPRRHSFFSDVRFPMSEPRTEYKA
jgi:hypothetical protein